MGRIRQGFKPEGRAMTAQDAAAGGVLGSYSERSAKSQTPTANSGLPYFPESTPVRYTVNVPQNNLAFICTGKCWGSSVYQIQIRPRFFSGP